jgi:hypothetical protein
MKNKNQKLNCTADVSSLLEYTLWRTPTKVLTSRPATSRRESREVVSVEDALFPTRIVLFVLRFLLRNFRFCEQKSDRTLRIIIDLTSRLS